MIRFSRFIQKQQFRRLLRVFFNENLCRYIRVNIYTKTVKIFPNYFVFIFLNEIVIPQFITKFSIDTFIVRERESVNIVVYTIECRYRINKCI